MIDYYFQKADFTILEAEILQQNNLLFGSISRLYYAAYYIVSAYLLHKGISSKTHKGVIKQLNLLSVEDRFITTEDKLLLQTLFDARQESDYGDFIQFNKDEVQGLIEQTKALIIKYKQALR